ncbi:MAG TPA: hypothetical protein VF997_09000 [Polyangia bacterium]
MSWKRRLLELSLAGGMLAAAGGCDHTPTTVGPIPLCNANPDPCCSQPQSQACYDYQHRDLGMPPDLAPPHDLASTD